MFKDDRLIALTVIGTMFAGAVFTMSQMTRTDSAEDVVMRYHGFGSMTQDTAMRRLGLGILTFGATLPYFVLVKRTIMA